MKVHMCVQVQAILKTEHGARGIFHSDSYADHGQVYKAYLASGYEAADDVDLVLDERITGHAEFAVFALWVPEHLETGLWHHVEMDSAGKTGLVLHTGRSQPNLPVPKPYALLTSPLTIREGRQAAYQRLRALDLPASERARLHLDDRRLREAYRHVHKRWQARKEGAREPDGEADDGPDENEEEFESGEEDDEEYEGLDEEDTGGGWGSADDDDDDDETAAGALADAMEPLAEEADEEDEEQREREAAAREHLQWEVKDGVQAGFTTATAFLRTHEGRVRVGDYMGAVMDGLPHGHGRLTMRSGVLWVGMLVGGEVNGPGALTYPDGSTYTGKAVSKNEQILRWGEGRHVPSSRLPSRVKQGLWYDDELDLPQEVSGTTMNLAFDAYFDAEKAASEAAGTPEEGGEGSAPQARERSDGRAAAGSSTQPVHKRARNSTSEHAVSRLFRLRRLLPAEHAAQGDGHCIEKLERAIQARPEQPWHVRDATTNLQHMVIVEWAFNRQLVMQHAQTEASHETSAEVTKAQEMMEVQEMWSKSQNVNVELYYQGWKALAKQKGKAIVRAPGYVPGEEKKRWNVTTTEAGDLMKRARLTVNESSLHFNDDLAQRGAARNAIRHALRDKAQWDELKRAYAKLKKLLADVELQKSEIERIKDKRKADADLALRAPAPDEPSA